MACAVSRFAQSVFSEVGIAHAYSSFLCTLYTVGLCNSLFKNTLPPANATLLDSAYALKLINEVRTIFTRAMCAVKSLRTLQVSPHVGAPLARVARNRGVDEDAYLQVSDVPGGTLMLAAAVVFIVTPLVVFRRWVSFSPHITCSSSLPSLVDWRTRCLCGRCPRVA